MKKHGQAVLLLIYILFLFLNIPNPYSLFIYVFLGLIIALTNPYYFILLIIPFLFLDLYIKIFLISLTGLYLLLRLIWFRKNSLSIIYIFILSATFIYINFIYDYNFITAFIYYLISIGLGMVITYFSGISKFKTKIINFNYISLYLLILSFVIILTFKPIYYELYLIMFCFYISFYLNYITLVLAVPIYLIYKPFIIPFICLIILFKYKSLLLYVLTILLYYSVFKGNIEYFDYIFISYFCVCIFFYYEYKTIENKKENSLYSTLAYDFYSYLSDLDVLVENKNNLTYNFSKIQNDISLKYCQKCNNKFCKKPDQNFIFLKSIIYYQATNYMDCPNYSYIPKDNTKQSTKYYPHQAIKTLLYSYHNDGRELDEINKKFQGYLNILQIEKIKYRNFIPSFYNLAFSIELLYSKNFIEGFFEKLTNLYFKQKLEYKIVDKENSLFITVSQKQKIQITYAHAILNKGNNCISGDNFLIKKTFDKRQIFALSDGMGSGMDAYYASKELLEVVSNMLKYHFSTTTLLNYLSYIYEIKGNYESYATLDLLQVNLITGVADLYKLGSSTSYLFSDTDRVFENSNLPLNYSDLIDSYEIPLKSKDILVLVSDGFTDTVSTYELKEIIKKHSHLSAGLIVEELCSFVKNKNEQLKDDCSIIVLKVN